MSKHKALELADVMDCLSATQRNSDNAAGQAAAELRALHALIVQMREAIKLHQESDFNSDHPALDRAAKDADQYLGEQK